MRCLPLAICLAAWAAIPAAPAVTTAADWQEAQEQLKARPRECIVLLTGTDWDPVSARAVAILKDETFLKTAGNAILTPIDHPDFPDTAAKARLERNEGFRHIVYHYPALFLYDHDGVLVGLQEGLTDSPAKASALLARWQEQIKRRDALLAEARTLDGPARAAALGRALDALDYDSGRRHKAVLEEIARLDPGDTLGYTLKYTFHPYPFAEHEIINGNEEKRAAALVTIKGWLTKAHITLAQRQECLAMMYAVYAHTGVSFDEQIATLEKLIALDPRSDTAIGARRVIDLLRARDRHRSAEQDYRRDLDNPKARDAFIAATVALGEKLPALPASGEPLITAGATPSFSSLSGQYDNPIRHVLIGRGDALGGFHSNSEVQPWCRLDLGRDFLVSRVALVNRAGCAWRLPPIVLEVSADGKDWTALLRDTRSRELYVAEPAKPVRARYVRARRDDPRNDFFHFSNLLAWGRPAE